MSPEEYDKIIEQLKLQVPNERATFGIFQYGGGSGESYIQADKDGLRLFALELLIAAQKAEEIYEDEKTNIIPLSYNESWVDEDSDTIIQYVKPIDPRSVARATAAVTNTVKDYLIGGGCILTLFFIILSIIIGVVSILKWIF